MLGTINPFSGSLAFGSANSALIPQMTVVLPSLTIAEPSAVWMELTLTPVGRYCWNWKDVINCDDQEHILALCFPCGELNLNLPAIPCRPDEHYAPGSPGSVLGGG